MYRPDRRRGEFDATQMERQTNQPMARSLGFRTSLKADIKIHISCVYFHKTNFFLHLKTFCERNIVPKPGKGHLIEFNCLTSEQFCKI